MYVVSRAQMRKIEGDVMLSGRLSGFDLMQNAASGVLDTIMEHFNSDVRTKPMVIFCGSGNNAGDGYVIAYMLWERGAKITVVSVSDPAKLTPLLLQVISKAGAGSVGGVTGSVEGVGSWALSPVTTTSSCPK